MSLKLAAFVDGSVYSASVCDHAAWLANLNAPSQIMVTHMLGRRSRQSVPADLSGNLSLGARTDLLTKLSAADEEWAQLALARGRAILEDVSARLADKTDATVETRLRHDDLADAIAEQEADVIVIGKRGEASGFAREHLGSNLERVLRGSDKPVLVANYEFSPIERCLIAYDGGTSIAKAVRYLSGSAAAAYAGIAFHILKAGDDTPDSRAELEGVAATLKQAGLSATWEIGAGEPEQAIPNAAIEKQSQMVIMGAYGHSRIRNLIIGSTTTSLVRSCRLPILMFR
ncbi:MAG: universal stress protein [Alphaproteobacteria bacterium]|nr:universal stress protein [Alphaproteobacteria bacterium]